MTTTNSNAGNSQQTTNNQKMALPSVNTITDMMMNNMMMTNFSEIMSGKYELTFRNVCKLIMLTQVGSIKDFAKEGIEYFFKNFKYFCLAIMMLMSQIYSKIKSIEWKTEEISQQIEVVEKVEKSHIDPNLEFMRSFYLFILDCCQFTKKIGNYEIKNNKDLFYRAVFSDISYNDTKFLNSVCFTINKHSGEIVKFDLSNNLADKKKSSSYRDYLTHEQKKIIDYLLENHPNFKDKKYKEICDFFVNCIPNNSGGQEVMSNFNEEDFTKILLSRHPYLGEYETTATIYIISYIYQKFVRDKDVERSSFTIVYYDLLYGKDHTFGLDTSNNYLNTFNKVRRTKGNYINIISNYSHNLNFGEYFSKSVYKEAFENFECSMVKQMSVDDKLEIDTEDSDLVFEIIEKVKSYSTRNEGSNISINKLTLEREVKTKQIPNKAYKKWKKQMDMVVSMTTPCVDKKKNGEKQELTTSQKEIILRMNQNAPDEFIDEDVHETKIVTSKINEDYRRLESLYLKESDKQFLRSTLEQFKDCKDMMKELGFDNKMNICLYGEPGTGKSTTIVTIASFLQKDIYYVNLKEVNTNKDIHDIFEHVNKNVTSGGIIVLEDIDCMSDIVLKREDEIEEGVCDLLDNQDDQLNLSYLLNLLQGCMTMEDSVVIMTTNKRDKLDPALFRDGRMNLSLELKACDHFQIRNIFKKMKCRDINEDVLNKIEELKYTPAKIMYHIKKYVNSDVSDEEIMSPFMTI